MQASDMSLEKRQMVYTTLELFQLLCVNVTSGYACIYRWIYFIETYITTTLATSVAGLFGKNNASYSRWI
jgi:hypothetical protein